MLYLGPRAVQPVSTATDYARRNWQHYYQQQAMSSSHPLLRQFYAKGMVQSDSPISEVPLLALDIETTGLDPNTNGIVSIGLTPMTSNYIASSKAKQWLVKPRFALNARSVTLHGITHTTIANAPDLTDILPEFLAALAGNVVVVHHAGIERPFLHAALSARFGEGIYFPIIDTMALEARLQRQKPLSWWQKLRRQPATSIRLADSRLRYGLPPYRPHHAVTDALACAELLQAQLAHHFSPNTAVNTLWC